MKMHLFLPAALLLLTATGSPQNQKSTPQEPPLDLVIASMILQGKTDEAVKAVKTPETVSATLRNILNIFDSQITMRRISEAQSLLDGTMKFVDACIQAGKVKDVPRNALRGRQLRLQGIQLSDQKEFARAESVLREALKIGEQTRDPVLVAGIHNNLGYALRNQNQLEPAAAEFETARQMAEAQKDNMRAGSYNLNLGGTLFQLGRLEPSLAAFRRSAEQNRAAMMLPLEAQATLMQGMVSAKIPAASSEALPLFRAAQALFEKLGDELNSGYCFYQMGSLAAANKDFASAAEQGEKALPLLLKADNKSVLQLCYELLENAYGSMGNAAKAAGYKKLADENAAKK